MKAKARKPGFWRRLFGQKSKEKAATRTYKGGEVSRLWYDWITKYSPDQEMTADFERLRSRARELKRNEPYITRYADLVETHLIGPSGMTLQSRARLPNGDLDGETNKEIERAWREWASQNVTVDGRYSLVDLEYLLSSSWKVDGELFVRTVGGFRGNDYLFALQPLDPDLLDHTYVRAASKGVNEIRMGIEVDSWGRPLFYHFWNSYDPIVRERVAIPASEIIHVMKPLRLNQTRGTTHLNPIMFPLRQLDGYFDAEITAARVGAAKMGLRWVVPRV